MATGTIDLPRGASPVVLTFDDSAKSQAGLLEDGRIDPDSAVGIMLDFAREHPRLPAGWDVLRQPRAVRRRPEGWRDRARLIALGFELGNHTLDHVRLDELTDEEVQREIVLGSRLIRELVPDVEIETIALPFGLLPCPQARARRVVWTAGYRFAGAFLAGAEPSRSPSQTTSTPVNPAHPHRPQKPAQRVFRLAFASGNESGATLRLGWAA